MENSFTLSLLRKTRRFIWYTFVTSLVIAAILVALARVLFPNIEGYRNQLESIASKYLGQPVKIEKFDARIIGLTPTLIFKDVSLLGSDGKNELVNFKEARISFSAITSIRKASFIPKSFTIVGIQLAVTRKKNNTFMIEGINVAQFDPSKSTENAVSDELSKWLFQQDILKLENSTIVWHDMIRNKTVKFSDINVQLRNKDNRHMLDGEWQLPRAVGKYFKVAMDMTGDILNPASWQGAVYVRADKIKIDDLGITPELFRFSLHGGIHDFEVWGSFELGQLKEITGAINVKDLAIKTPTAKKIVRIEELAGVVKWEMLADGWVVNVDRFNFKFNKKVWPLSRALIESHHKFQPTQILDIRFDEINLEDINQLLQKTKLLNKKTLVKIANANPNGVLKDTHLRFKLDDIFSDDFEVSTIFSNLGLNPVMYIPGFNNLSGTFHSNNIIGNTSFTGVMSSINYPNMFREVFAINDMQGRVDWKHMDGNWNIKSKGLFVRNNDITTESDFNFLIPDDKQSPVIDLQVAFNSGDAAKTSNYFPVSIMDKNLVEWLDAAIVSGNVEDGTVVMRGRISDFPFRNNTGKFNVGFNIKDFELNYQQDWPNVTHAEADIEISGMGIQIDIKSGKLQNTNIYNTSLEVNDFEMPDLIINGSLQGRTHDIFQFLVESPVASESKDTINNISITGESFVNINVSIPLSSEVERINPLHYKGDVTLKHSGLGFLNNKFTVDDINGKIFFDENGINANDIYAFSLDNNAKIKIFSRVQDGSITEHIVAQGKVSAEYLRNYYNIKSLSNSSGVTTWQAVLNLAYSTTTADVPATLVVTSDWKGISLDLPQPLVKEKNVDLYTSFETVFLPNDQYNFRATIKDHAAANLHMSYSDNGWLLNKAAISLASDQIFEVDNSMVKIQGGNKNIDVSAWSALLRDNDSNESENSLGFLYPISQVQLELNDYFILETQDSPEGQVDSDNTESVSADVNLDPRKLPKVKGIINNLVYRGNSLGKLEFDFDRVTEGFSINKLSLKSPTVNISASGLWHSFQNDKKSNQITKLFMKMKSENLGKFVSSLGYSSIIKDGTADSDLTIWWNNSPFNWSLKNIAADISLRVDSGEILEVEPGVEKLVGLLSLSALPQRLFGDFSDTITDGLKFSKIRGDIHIIQGQAIIDKLKIKSNIASIDITGRTGLVDRNYDHIITATPKIAETASVVGAFVFGPEIGVMAAIINELFGIDKSIKRVYRVKGSWEKPDIELISEQDLQGNGSEPAHEDTINRGYDE